ncbi:hypothetical protein [Priestia megaterium]|uniref:hypothetical protein n=1 Tax=Priestia megaterium TaxID=1404 RepID=UPI0013898438|nr:hypothetical protein [Priestia megaterium]WEZ37775.1 hypothetical protein P5636_21585 [Priestia megaterium DSM 319]
MDKEQNHIIRLLTDRYKIQFYDLKCLDSVVKFVSPVVQGVCGFQVDVISLGLFYHLLHAI